ncbi:MAG: threonine--tRNA ligase, partial [Actinomycetota bacterium]|nr:threonine--tRNA ligase [Actinomycetota bacterium]MDQ3901837.1 threonine--tRNA ligase [Actinomycetota bacterium]
MVAPSSPVQPAVRVTVPAGTTAGAALRDGGAPTTGPDAVVVARDDQGALRDLTWVPDRDTDVEAVAASSPDGRSVIRHSCAHVLAQAVQQHFPGAKLGVGPPVTDGFYYDFDVERPFTPEDLADLEKTMRKIIKSGQRFSRRVFRSVSEAKHELADEPYKLE